MSTDWLIAISTIALAIGTIALALVAAFQDIIRAWVMRPKLDASITMAPPDCHKTKMKSIGDRYPKKGSPRETKVGKSKGAKLAKSLDKGLSK